MRNHRKSNHTVNCRLIVSAILFLSVRNLYGEERPRYEADRPVCIHPDNPKYFLFRGRPLVFITATEHYGSVINRPFDWKKYLANASEKRQTLTRTFLLFRELQTPRNPSSPCKPESPDYIAPWLRTGPGLALDGEPRYDLDRWNPEFFERLHSFLKGAAERGIVVELTLFSNSYIDKVWALNPMRADNNLQKVGKVAHPIFMSLHNEELLKRQLNYVSKVVSETCIYDNVYYEVCNEPGAGDGTEDGVTPKDVDAWQARIAEAIRDELKKQNKTHLVLGSQSWSYKPKFRQDLDDSFSGKTMDAVNVHPLPNTVLAGRSYELGNFMAKELVLTDYRDFCYATEKFPKPCVLDEDNTASAYRDDIGWTIHRKRAWTGVLGQCHYDFIDFTITVGNETGTPESDRKIRNWMKHLSEFIHSFDFIHAQPLHDWFKECPKNLVATVLANTGKDYVAYLADAREVNDLAVGELISGDLSFQLPAGEYKISLYSPVSGEYSPAMVIRGGDKAITLSLPPFKHDIALRVTRQD